jgi:hypothetical protein
MTTAEIGRLERVALRQVWRHEARDFTQLLEQNIDVLNDALDLNLVNVDREQAAGTFSVDLVAEEANGGTVIIENQLAKSDHDHLGKLITYLTAMQARAAIWIVSDPRPEHLAAVQWLNQAVGADFYMVKVEAVRIGDSPPAALFTLIVGPSEEAKEVGIVRKDIAERSSIRKRWWTELLERAAKKSRLHAHISPSEFNWANASSGFAGLAWSYVVTQQTVAAVLYIDQGRNTQADNKRLFDQLAAHKAEIEEAFGGPLSWERMDTKKASQIRYTSDKGGYRSPDEQWPAIQDTQIDAMVRLERALKPFIDRLKEPG